MTNSEVICEFMEPRPTMSERMGEGWAFKWWGRDGKPATALDLDSLREVEARLTDKQWRAYERAICEAWDQSRPTGWRYVLHLSPEQKIVAIAKVLRAEKDDHAR
jgi:hypothetical protein